MTEALSGCGNSDHVVYLDCLFLSIVLMGVQAGVCSLPFSCHHVVGPPDKAEGPPQAIHLRALTDNLSLRFLYHTSFSEHTWGSSHPLRPFQLFFLSLTCSVSSLLLLCHIVYEDIEGTVSPPSWVTKSHLLIYNLLIYNPRSQSFYFSQFV